MEEGPSGPSAKGAQQRKERSSRFRGVTKHRRSGRWEAHLWVKDLGKQIYLGGYETEEHAAEAYDVAALKVKGSKVKTNFELSRYTELLSCMDSISLDELVMAVRRQSQGFSRGSSTYRGVTRHPSGRWESRIGVPGSRHVYLGLFVLEEEAAKAYDRSLVRLRGPGAATNFSLGEYNPEMEEHALMQQRVKESGAVDMISCLGPDFERWIKQGDKEGLPATQPLTSTAAGAASSSMLPADSRSARQPPGQAHEGGPGASPAGPSGSNGRVPEETCLLPMHADMCRIDGSEDLVLLPEQDSGPPQGLAERCQLALVHVEESLLNCQQPGQLPPGQALFEGAAKALARFGQAAKRVAE